MTAKNFSTLEEFMEFALQNGYDSQSKWDLNSQTNRVWDDEEAGTAWYSELNALRADPKYPGTASEEFAQWLAAETKLFDRRPPMHSVTDYHLTKKMQGWGRGTTLWLSEELGKMIADIWTMRPQWVGGPIGYSRAGLTLTSICKRLGKSEVGARIKEIEAARDAESRKNSRNYARQTASGCAQKILALMVEYPEIIWPAQLSEIAVLLPE
jgi:hypothetical protein